MGKNAIINKHEVRWTFGNGSCEDVISGNVKVDSPQQNILNNNKETGRRRISLSEAARRQKISLHDTLKYNQKLAISNTCLDETYPIRGKAKLSQDPKQEIPLQTIISFMHVKVEDNIWPLPFAQLTTYLLGQRYVVKNKPAPNKITLVRSDTLRKDGGNLVVNYLGKDLVNRRAQTDGSKIRQSDMELTLDNITKHT